MSARTLNETIYALNRILPPEQQLLGVAWGVASISDLRQAVKELYRLVGFPEYAGFMTQPEDAPLKRQRPGGVAV